MKYHPKTFQLALLALLCEASSDDTKAFKTWLDLLTLDGAEALPTIERHAREWLQHYTKAANTAAGTTATGRVSDLQEQQRQTRGYIHGKQHTGESWTLLNFDQAAKRADLFRRVEAMTIEAQQLTEEEETERAAGRPKILALIRFT